MPFAGQFLQSMCHLRNRTATAMIKTGFMQEDMTTWLKHPAITGLKRIRPASTAQRNKKSCNSKQ
jgi:hypothetical protein